MLDLPAGIGAALGFFLCIYLHEVATAQAAASTGDRSPRLYGRMTLRFRAHADPIGTYILPAVFTLGFMFSAAIIPVFGWGKRHTLGSGRTSLLPPLIGPAVTLAIAVVAGIAARAGGGVLPFTLAYVACSLTVIELLPIPGRDGGRVLRRFLSPSAASTMDDLEKYEILFLLVLFMFLRGVVASMVEALFGVIIPAPGTAPIIG